MNHKLRDWIVKYGGIKKVSSKLKVSDHQVRTWLRGEATPKVATIDKLIRLSKNELSFEIIFKETSRTKK